MLMWQAECLDCAFKVTRLTRKEADAAVEAHIRDTHHERWLIVPAQDPPKSAAEGKRKTGRP
jgi:hypothetical protein